MTQGWGSTPSGRSPGGDDDATRSFAPVTPDPTTPGELVPPPDYRHNPFYAGDQGQQASYHGQPGADPAALGYGGYPGGGVGGVGNTGNTGGGGKGGVVIAVIAAVLAVAVFVILLVTQWGRLFGGDDSAAEAPVTATVVVPADGGQSSSGSSTQSSAQNSTQGADQNARPTTASLPAGTTAVNDAARSGEPTGNFNSVWISGPTTDGFAIAVRDAYVAAYLGDRNTNQTVVAVSPRTHQSYTMSCSDTGSYVHCTGGNNANVYIA